MNRFQSNYSPAAAERPAIGRGMPQGAWDDEISREQETMTASDLADTSMMSMSGGQPAQLHMQNNLPTDVVTSPVSTQEAYMGSLKAMLSKNVGNYIVATFLVGTQGTFSWEGILYDVGNDYLTIYQQSRDRYIVSDIYSLKFIEFYDTERREMCNELLRQNNGNTWSRG